jgi:AraC-like DNA-binding protein
MKPHLENIAAKKGPQAFLAFATHPPRFEFFWHYHPEYELTLIVQGHGQRMVGDSHEPFGPGDLVLLGPGLPHTWVSAQGGHLQAEAVVVQFPADFIHRFHDLQELSALRPLLQQAGRGLVFSGKKVAAVAQAMQALPAQTGMRKIADLLLLLAELPRLKARPLASARYQPLRGPENESRLNTVCRYVQQHYAGPVSIQQAAALIHVSPGAFCKFFKRITGQTFSDYVNDIRVASVCQQLAGTRRTVADIAYSNGFETLTYFNRVFLKKKGMPPGKYRASQLHSH